MVPVWRARGCISALQSNTSPSDHLGKLQPPSTRATTSTRWASTSRKSIALPASSRRWTSAVKNNCGKCARSSTSGSTRGAGDAERTGCFCAEKSPRCPVPRVQSSRCTTFASFSQAGSCAFVAQRTRNGPCGMARTLSVHQQGPFSTTVVQGLRTSKRTRT